MSAGSGLRREEDPMGLFTPRPLCPQAQLAEDELKKDLAGAKAFGAVRLGGDCCAVFLVNRFYTRRVKVRELPEAQELCVNPLPERDAVLALMRWWHKQ